MSNLQLKKRLRAARLIVRGLTADARRLPPQRFFLVAGSRVGSTLLVDLLNSHPAICCLPEERLFFRQPRIGWPDLYLRGLAAACARPVFGGKLRPGALLEQGIDPVAFWQQFVADGGRLLLLERADRLAQAVSGLIANARNQWHNTAATDDLTQRFTLDPALVLQKLDKQSRSAARFRASLGALPRLELEYGRDLRDPAAQQATCDRIFAWLDLPPQPVATRYRKIVPDWTAVVSNDAEVRAAVAASPYAALLEGS